MNNSKSYDETQYTKWNKNNEIKEILDELKAIVETKDYENGLVYIEHSYLKAIHYYITNLQKSQETLIKNDNEIITNLQRENEILKLNHKQLKDIDKMAKSNSKLIKENTNLKAKIFILQERLKHELISKPDTEWTLVTEDGQKMSIIQSKRIDMQEELNKTITILSSRIDKAVKIIQNDTTLNPERQRERLINILQGGDNK